MLHEVTRSIVELIEATTHVTGAAPWVVAGSLNGDASPAVDKLTISLYAVEEHEHLRNQPLVRTDAGYVRPPLALRLHYVMAYVGTDDLEAQSRLSLVIQTLYSTPILGPAELRPAIRSLVDRLTIRMRNPGPDERSQIWSALGRSQPLALYYEADVALIEPVHQEGHGEIVQAQVRYGELTP